MRTDSPHVRNELATRERYDLLGNGEELPRNTGVAWCGEDCSAQWFYQSLDHVALAVGSLACPQCIAAAVAALQQR